MTTTSPQRKSMWKALALLGGTFVLVSACSLIVDTNADQCTSNGDCATFGAICQAGVCVSSGVTEGGPPTDGSSSGDVISPDGACTPKPKTTQDDFLNEPCTNAQCIPFDDCARLGTCDAGALPTLIDPPPGGA